MLFVIFDLLIMRILIVMSISNVFFIISDRRYYWRNFIIFAFAIRLIFNNGFLCYGRLLIVPYGIETLRRLVLYAISLLLLIVPYGIETMKEE